MNREKIKGSQHCEERDETGGVVQKDTRGHKKEKKYIEFLT